MADLTLEERVEHLHSECCELRRKLNEKEFVFDTEVGDLKEEIAIHLRTISDLNKTIKELNRELKDCVSIDKYKIIETRLEEECNRYENLIDLNEKYTKLHTAKSEECELLLKDLAEKDELLEASKASIKSMVTSLEKYSTIEEDLTKAKKEISEYAEERKSLIEEVESLRNTVTYYEELKHKSINESYIFSCDESMKLESPRNRSSCVPESVAAVFDIRFKELENELEEHKAILNVRNEEVEMLKRDKELHVHALEECKSRVVSLEEAAKINDEEVIRLNSEKMVFEDLIKSLNDQMEKCNGTISEYQKCVANYQAKINDFEVKVSELISENEKSEAKLKEQINELDKEVQEWKQLVKDKDDDIQKVLSENYEKKTLLEKCKKEITRLLVEKEQMETDASQLRLDLKTVRAEVDSIQQSLLKQENEIETLRNREDHLAKELTRSNSELDYFIGRLRSSELENEQLKKDISVLEGKIEKRDSDIRKSFKDMTMLSRKWEERSDRYAKRVAEMELKLKEKGETEALMCQLKEDKEHIERQLSSAQKKIFSLQEESKIADESLNLERIHKERYRREVESLESELRKYKMQNQQSGNMTFLMPTTVNVSHSGDAATFLQAMQNFPNETVNSSSSFRRGPQFSTLSMADEEGEFMNPKNLSDLKRGVCETEGDISGRLSTLQRRNTLMPPHLQSSYPIEMQTVSLPTFTEDSMRKGAKVVQTSKESILQNIENRSYKSMEYFKATYRSSHSEGTGESNVPSHFLLSCTPSKIIKRVKYKHKWTPSKSKPKSK